ncbi:MAG: hypothetical protein LBT05_04805 [Planctomycetaceae bacterium]|jgi:hypothetical protein|nr:hypothetical protein [Planctomycetaceae bacterium]
MTELTILDELKNLLPPLTDSEYVGLETSILKDGCLSPLVTWNNILIDGRHRYAIAKKHQIPYAVKNVELANLDEAKLWAWRHQENRRNLTLYQRTEIALQFKPMITAKAKEKMVAGGGDQKSSQAKSGSPNSSNPIKGMDTRQEIAKIAGVAPDTVSRVEYLNEHADDTTKEKLRQGKTTINKEYKRVREELPPQTAEQTPAENKSNEESKPKLGLYLKPGEKSCAETLEPYVPRTTLKNIPQDHPRVLVINLDAHFRKGYIEDLILYALEFLREDKKIKIPESMMKELTKRLKNNS